MHLTSIKAHRGVVHTPLRYPGGKTRLAGFMGKIVGQLDNSRLTFIEPFAGGAGIALSLLYEDKVSKIVLNDKDPKLYSFWKYAVDYNKEFLRVFDQTPVTIEEWHRQREVYKRVGNEVCLESGFATFFLNRTNRSGVLNAGVIGGQLQRGRYRLDARFNRSDLRRKIEALGIHAKKITITGVDGVELLSSTLARENSLAYIDPPYIEKGSFLYSNLFSPQDHAELAGFLSSKRDHNWVLTYDDVPEVRKLYLGMYQGTYSLPYSAHTTTVAKERIVFSDSVAVLDGVIN